jgi:hypothetical protein
MLRSWFSTPWIPEVVPRSAHLSKIHCHKHCLLAGVELVELSQLWFFFLFDVYCYSLYCMKLIIYWIRPTFRFQLEQEFFPCPTASRQALGTTPPPTYWVPMALCPGVKPPLHEAYNLPAYSTVFKYAWNRNWNISYYFIIIFHHILFLQMEYNIVPSIPPYGSEIKNGGTLPRLPCRSSWRGAWLIKNRNNFIFILKEETTSLHIDSRFPPISCKVLLLSTVVFCRKIALYVGVGLVCMVAGGWCSEESWQRTASCRVVGHLQPPPPATCGHGILKYWSSCPQCCVLVSALGITVMSRICNICGCTSGRH